MAFFLLSPGPVLLTLLFIAATTYTEYLSSPKYPLYKIYQEICPMLFPFIPMEWPAEHAIQTEDKKKTE
jgi:hypothetical protein